jgi:hypothetical protein
LDGGVFLEKQLGVNLAVAGSNLVVPQVADPELQTLVNASLNYSGATHQKMGSME